MTEYRIVIFLDNDKHIWIEFIQDPNAEYPISLETTSLIELLDVDNGIDTLHIPDRARDHRIMCWWLESLNDPVWIKLWKVVPDPFK